MNPTYNNFRINPYYGFDEIMPEEGEVDQNSPVDRDGDAQFNAPFEGALDLDTVREVKEPNEPVVRKPFDPIYGYREFCAEFFPEYLQNTTTAVQSQVTDEEIDVTGGINRRKLYFGPVFQGLSSLILRDATSVAMSSFGGLFLTKVGYLKREMIYQYIYAFVVLLESTHSSEYKLIMKQVKTFIKIYNLHFSENPRSFKEYVLERSTPNAKSMKVINDLSAVIDDSIKNNEKNIHKYNGINLPQKISNRLCREKFKEIEFMCSASKVDGSEVGRFYYDKLERFKHNFALDRLCFFLDRKKDNEKVSLHCCLLSFNSMGMVKGLFPLQTLPQSSKELDNAKKITEALSTNAHFRTSFPTSESFFRGELELSEQEAHELVKTVAKYQKTEEQRETAVTIWNGMKMRSSNSPDSGDDSDGLDMRWKDSTRQAPSSLFQYWSDFDKRESERSFKSYIPQRSIQTLGREAKAEPPFEWNNLFRDEIAIDPAFDSSALPDWSSLFEYQKRAVQYICSAYEQNQGIGLFDDMGLGKTKQASTVVEYLYKKKKLKGPLVVVCDKGLIQTWEKELSQAGIAERDIVVWHDTHRAKRKVNKNSIIITTYNTLSRDLNVTNKSALQTICGVIDQKAFSEILSSEKNSMTSEDLWEKLFNQGFISAAGFIKAQPSERLLSCLLSILNDDRLANAVFEVINNMWEVQLGGVVCDEIQHASSKTTAVGRTILALGEHCDLRRGLRLALTGTPISNSLGDFWTIHKFLNFSQFPNYDDYKRFYVTSHRKFMNMLQQIFQKVLNQRSVKEDKSMTDASLTFDKEDADNLHFDYQKLACTLDDLHRSLLTVSKKFSARTIRRTKTDPEVLRDIKNTGNSTIPMRNDKAVRRWDLSTSQQGLLGSLEKTNQVATEIFNSTNDFDGNNLETSHLSQIHQKAKVMDHPVLNDNSTLSKDLFQKPADEAVWEKVTQTYGDSLVSESGRLQGLMEVLPSMIAQRYVKKGDKLIPLEQNESATPGTTYGSRIVIIIKYLPVAHMLKRLIKEKFGVTSSIIEGSASVKSRQEIIKKFNSSSSSPEVVILSPKAGGAGINLFGSDVIVYNVEWTPAGNDQAVDRAFRVNSPYLTVNVHRMECRAPGLDQHIQSINLQKRNLISLFVDRKPDCASLEWQMERYFVPVTASMTQDDFIDAIQNVRANFLRYVQSQQTTDSLLRNQSLLQTQALPAVIPSPLVPANSRGVPESSVSSHIQTTSSSRRVPEPSVSSHIQNTASSRRVPKRKTSQKKPEENNKSNKSRRNSEPPPPKYLIPLGRKNRGSMIGTGNLGKKS